MNSYRQTYKMLIIVMTFFLVFTLINLMDYYSKIAQHQRISNQYYTEEAITFQGDLCSVDVSHMKSIFSNKGLILYKLINPVEDIRIVLSSDKFIHPPLIKGRFFDIEDFFTENNVAVVGSSFVPRFKKIEDKNYYEYDNILYEVIGIIGYERASLLDHTVFLSANFRNIDMEGLYIIDGNNESEIQYFLKNQSILSSIDILDREFVHAERVLGLEDSGNVIFILIMVMLSFSYLLLVLYWIKKNHKEFFIRRMYGHSFHLIIFNFIGDLFILNIVGIVGGIVYLIVYRHYLNTSNTTLFLVIFASLVAFTCFNTTLLISTLINKKNRPIYDKIR